MAEAAMALAPALRPFQAVEPKLQDTEDQWWAIVPGTCPGNRIVAVGATSVTSPTSDDPPPVEFSPGARSGMTLTGIPSSLALSLPST